MSSRYERDRRDSGRRDSRDRRSSRRSPSPPPKPRDDKELPEAFGRVPEKKEEDDSNVLYRMKHSFKQVPLGSLAKCLDGKKKIKVWTRNFKEVRGICTGYLIAFDKHWNLVMDDVDEVYLKPRKAKTPYLDVVESAADFPELPKRQPVKKKKKPEGTTNEQPPPPPEKESSENDKEGQDGNKGGEKKKKRRKRRKGPTTLKRHIEKLFVRGDNIVMAAVINEAD